MPIVWSRFYRQHLLLLAVTGMCLALLFHLSTLDVQLEDAWFSASGEAWPLRNAWWTSTLIHAWLRYVLNIAALACIWQAWKHRRGTDALRWRAVAISALAVPLLVGIGKRLSPMHCPWDIDRYGGLASYYDPIAALFAQIPEPGHCFPAGFVSAGSWLLAFVLFFYPARPRVSLAVGLGATVLILAMGLVQQMRGAHFLSHVLWTLWLSWAIVLGVHAALRPWRHPPPVLGDRA